MLLTAGQLAQAQFHGDRYGEAWLDEAISTNRTLRRPRALAWALFWRGRLLVVSAPAESKESLEEALSIFRTREDALGAGWALYFLGNIAYETYDDERYIAVSSELSEFASKNGTPALLGLAIERDAFDALTRGDTTIALEYAGAAVEHQRRGDRFNLVSALIGLAWVAMRVGNRKRALEALGEAVELGRRIGTIRERGSAILVAAAMLVDAGAENEAREVLYGAGFLEGHRFRAIDSRWSREKVDFIQERLDLTQPIAPGFNNPMATSEWILEWIATELPTCSDEIPADDAWPNTHDPGSAETTGAAPITPRSSLIGRADVMARVEHALNEPGLVTLVGPGGIGKTRLLQEAHARFAERFERVWRIDLVATRDRAGVESLLEEVILPARDPMSPSPRANQKADLIAEIATRLTGGRTLLALDNCEQLVEFLPTLVETLLARSSLTVLATSREPLAARGEIVIPVNALAVPDGDTVIDLTRLSQVESVELLVTRARERGADITLSPETADDVASICRQLDGIPLAIELAAARLAATSAHDLAQRLPRQLDVLATRQGEPRHRTLRSAVEWSYDLLESDQQQLLRRLGIFVGGFTLEAAEEICSDDATETLSAGESVYLNLAELVAKSLVLFDRERSRYRLLEPIRQFARQLLESSGEITRVAERHAQWALRRSRETLAARLLGEGQAEQHFQAELDNVHAALDWLRDNDTTTFLRLVAALGYTWFQTDWRRGRVVADTAVDLAHDASDRLRGGVLLARGIVEQRHNLSESGPWLHDARETYIRIDDAFGTAWSTFFLARSYVPRQPDDAKRLYLEALERFHQLGLTIGETWALLNLADEAQDWGRIEEARGYLDRLLPLTREANQASQLGTVLSLQARNIASSGDLETASRLMREAIDAQLNVGDRWNLQGMLNDAAWIELSADRLDAAAQLVQQVLRISLEIDEEWGLRETLLVLAVIHLRNGNDAEACKLLATTGWDVERPEWLYWRTNTVWALALRQLEHLNCADHEDSTREGRRLGVLGAARASLT